MRVSARRGRGGKEEDVEEGRGGCGGGEDVVVDERRGGEERDVSGSRAGIPPSL